MRDKILNLFAAILVAIWMVMFWFTAAAKASSECAPELVALMFHKSWGLEEVETVKRPNLRQNGLPITYSLWVAPDTGAWLLTGATAGHVCPLRMGHDYRQINFLDQVRAVRGEAKKEFQL